MRNKRIIQLAGCLALSLSATAQSSLPFVETFDTEESMNKFVVIDANEDGVTWRYDKEQRLVRYDYNDYKAGDDWLFLPAIHFEKDKEYRISFTTQCRSAAAIETVEVTIGAKAEVDEQKPIADKLSVVWPSPKETEYKFTVEESGDYNLAFHEISAAAKYFLLLDDIKVSEVVNVAVPGIVSDTSLKPAEKGEKSVDISFTAPSLDANGAPLAKISSINVYREDLKGNVKTFTNPTPGEKLSFTDTVNKSGIYTYKITVNNEGGNGETVTEETYVGYDVPIEIADIKAVADGNKVKIKWTAPTEGIHGGYIDTQNLQYSITRANTETPLATVKGTEFVDDKIDYNYAQQELNLYTIKAINNEVVNEGAKSNLVISGEPYMAPFDESFAYASTSLYPWYSENTYSEKEKYWDVRTYGFSPQTYAMDDDAGLLLFRSYSAPKGTHEYFLSPLFDISEMLHPIFVYHVYHTSNAADKDYLTIECAKDGGEFKAFGNPVTLGAENEGWEEYYVELDELLDSKYIQLGLKGHAEGGHNIHVDKLALIDNYYDVMPTKPVIDKDVTINTQFPVRTTIVNSGNKTVENIEVRLLRNGEVVETKNINALEPAMETDVTFSVEEDVFAAGTTVVYSVQTSAEQDEKTNNDISEETDVDIVMPSLPVASNLKATTKGGNVELTWDNAGIYNNYMEAMEDFESYPAFAIDGLAPWTLVDEDKEKTGDWYIRYEHVNEPMAFQVFNTEEAGLTSSEMEALAAHSGKQYLISFFNDDTTIANDDWLISSEVSADKPISFYAKTLSRGYKKEKIEVYYSETGKAVSDFKLLAEELIPYNWTEFNYRLPSTARYFAIRHITLDGSALMIDDITYAQKDKEPMKETPLGYNIYRDNKKINDLPVETCTYTDETATVGKHIYKVTAVYGVGESYFSNEAEIDNVATGINTAKKQGASFSFVGGRLMVDGAYEGAVSVYGIDGTLVDRLEGSKRVSTMLGKGTYIVKYNGKVMKLVNR